MAMQTTANPASVADRLQTYFSQKLLEVQTDELQMEQFGEAEDLPANNGNTSITFFKPEKASSTLYGASPTAKTDVVGKFTVGGGDEGSPISTFRENIFTKVVCTLQQYAQSTRISDIQSMVDAYQPLKANIKLMGLDAAVFYDSLVRNAIQGSTHPDGASTPLTHANNGADGCELFVTGDGVATKTGLSATNFATLSGLTQQTGKAFRKFVVAMGTQLRVNKAPKLKGRYAFLLPPQVMQDLCTDSRYENAFNGRGNDGVFKGMIGEIDGFRFFEHTNPFIEDETYGTYGTADGNGDGLIYSCIALGAGAFGCPKLKGTTSPLRPRVYIVDKADSANPAAQFITASWKVYLMALGLDKSNLVVGRCKSTFA
jgi:N4-gp56 family major capsid protein